MTFSTTTLPSIADGYEVRVRINETGVVYVFSSPSRKWEIKRSPLIKLTILDFIDLFGEPIRILK